MILKVDHRKQRQLPENGPWIFWKREAKDDPAAGLVVASFACAEPGCECREVKLEARKVDDSLQRAELKGGRLVLEFADHEGLDGSEVFRAALDIDSGELLPGEDAWDPLVAQWLVEEIDGEVLDRLHSGWLVTKNLARVEAHASHTIRATKPGEMVPWQDVFPMSRQDVYLTPEGSFEVLDAHCIDAGCPCTTAAVQILRKDEPVGAVMFDYKRSNIESVRDLAVSRETLDDVWARYSRRYRVASHLAAHAKQVKAAASQVRREAARRATVQHARKVGRNEPCPCGSGKKYKRCCLPR